MADEISMALAQKVYNTLCTAIERRNWHYQREDEKLLVRFGVSGDDIPMDFVIIVDADRQLVRLMSPLSFRMPEDKLLEGAIATCAASYGLVDGNFDYDISDGTIAFRMTASFRESFIGDGLFQYMISCATVTVDSYNDKFFAISKGIISIEDFLAKE